MQSFSISRKFVKRNTLLMANTRPLPGSKTDADELRKSHYERHRDLLAEIEVLNKIPSKKTNRNSSTG